MANPLVIDADGHLMEAGADWQERLEPAFRERAPHIEAGFRGNPG